MFELSTEGEWWLRHNIGIDETFEYKFSFMYLFCLLKGAWSCESCCQHMICISSILVTIIHIEMNRQTEFRSKESKYEIFQWFWFSDYKEQTLPFPPEPDLPRVIFVFMLKSSFYELKYLFGIVQVSRNHKYSVINGSNYTLRIALCESQSWLKSLTSR